jgi:ABC-type transport system involved in multi-copper enzyme maturation permease subunit
MDLRVPSGLFFLLLGIIVTLVGALSPGTTAPLADINVNLYSGISMVLFGAILLALARRSSFSKRP